MLRTAALALFASAAFVNAPVFGQAAPVVAPPPPVQAAPPPPMAVTPPAIRPAPAPRATPEQPRAPAPAPEARRTERPAARTTERSARPVSRPAPAAAAPAPAPEAAPATTAPAPVPVAEAPPPALQPIPADPVPVATDAAAPETESSAVPWLVLAGVALVIALAGLFFWRRRRSAEEAYYDEPVYDEPVAVAEPVAVQEPVAAAVPERDYQPALITPAFSRPEPIAEPEVVAAGAGLSVHEADRADMEALNASSSPEGHRPWLEFLMRPVRAGTTDDEALVEFELTVGNTGTVAAEDVRISTWLLAGGASEMESALIEPPANASTSETRIAPGDGAKVDASIALPRARLLDGVLPVVVADARYRLPGGGEGRTSARFAVGLPSGDGLQPFAVALGEGFSDDVEARLQGEPEHV